MTPVEFLQWWRPSGVLTLSAITPDGPIETRSWVAGAPAWTDAQEWINARNGLKNLYFVANEARLIDSKPKKEDITDIHCAFTDADPDPTPDYKTGRIKVLKAAEALMHGEFPPSVIIDSGHGVNALWRLDEALTDVEAFEAINKPFSEITGGKGIFNADRLLRLPGTTNLPTKTKLKKGYPSSPTAARIIFKSEATYSLNDVRTFVARHHKANWHAPPLEVPNHRMLFYPDIMSRWHGDATGLQDSTRSGLDMSLASLLKGRGFSYEETREILTKFPFGKGDENDERQFRRMWDRSSVDAPLVVVNPSADPGPFRASEFHGEAPAREWVVTDWIAKGVVNSLYGAGGVGKTLLAQQLAYCLGIGRPFLGVEVIPQKVLCVLCEDDRDELHRRHDALKKGLGIPVGNPFDQVLLWPRIGYDNLLVTWNANGEVRQGPAFEAVRREVLKEKPDLLILDTLADFFGGNEIIRPQVNHFLKTLLGGLIVEAGIAGFILTVLLLAHPSAAGLSTGSGTSGSTAWENAVRARLYMRKPADGHQDERELVRAKANYTTSGDEDVMRLLWQEGLFVVVAVGADDLALRSAKQQVIDSVRAAWAAGKAFTAKKGHERNIYLKLMPQLRMVKREILIQAIRQLIEDGEIMTSRRGKGGTVRGYKVAEQGDFEGDDA